MAMPWQEKENLQKWLKSPIKEIVIEGSNAKGENYLSTMRKQTVITEGGRAFSLIIKCRLLNGTTADLYEKTDIFKKEVEFYGNTIHAMRDILKEVFPDDEEPMTAECYYACEDFLVLEDLMVSGFKMHNRRVGLNLEQCLLALGTLAKFHAASVVLYERNPKALDKFKTSFFQEPTLQKPLGNFISGFLETLAEELETWDEEWHKYIPKLKLLAENSIARQCEITTRKDGDFNVLLHGDPWTNNMLFRDTSAGIRFVDFQFLNLNSPALDLHYFIGTSVDEDVCANHIRKLIEEYHKTLNYTLSALDYKKHIPTLEELKLEIERKALFGVFTVISVSAMMHCDPDCGFTLDEIFATGRTPGRSMYDEGYKKNLKVFLPSLDSKGGFETGV